MTMARRRTARRFLVLLLLAACGGDPPAKTSHERMLAALRDVRARTADEDPWLGDALARELRPVVAALPEIVRDRAQWWTIFRLGVEELRLGNEAEAVRLLERVVRVAPVVQPPVDPQSRIAVRYRLGVAYLRLAETQNCCASSVPGSCTLPLTGDAIHTRTEGARGAIDVFTKVARDTPPGSTVHLGACWLLNLACMLVDEHPDGVPEAFRIPAAAFRSAGAFPGFENVAARLGLDRFGLAGGAVADDFDNDGYLDLLVSNWDTDGQLRLHRNRRDGTFEDRTDAAHLRGLFGGLNMVQADYDNDGDVDVLVLRGAWLGAAGRHPNSLLRNRGDGTFDDVTFAAGLGEVHYPTQTAAWADYDNDGDVDLYVGNESGPALAAPGQLFRNNGDGTFTDVARRAGVTNDRFAKAVVWGDYDGDRFPDLFVSNLEQENRLYRNNGDGTFTDVAPRLGLTGPRRTFPAWFWDFDNDGKLDLYVSAYGADIWNLAEAALGLPLTTDLAQLWRGDGRGGFIDVARGRGLTSPNAPMGSNFGDLDNDGYLDFHLGTGFPSYDTVMPNVTYRNVRGEKFVEIGTSAGTAHLQKGHAVVFADFDNDGDQDLFEVMGGAYAGDGFYDVFYENPGSGHRWIAIDLVGVRSNRSAIGARLRVVVTEAGRERSVYKHVNSGGSFGANPLRQSVGLGRAERIERIEVLWPTTGETQVVRGVPLDEFVRIVEGEDGFKTVELKRLTLTH
jgi:hypothetical protein